MTSLNNFFNRFLSSAQHLPAGIYHYQSPPKDPRNYHLHLRLEEDGTGILIINASTILHLNQTAAEYAFYLVQNLSSDEVARKIVKRYHTTVEQAVEDYLNLSARIQTLINTPDLDPVTFLDFERVAPHTGHILAPYRLDCALTYRLPEHHAPEAAPTERVKQELTTEEWKKVLDKAWSVGIPHVVFTGGEPTLRPDLCDLIAHAQALGQVTGLLSDGLKLADKAYLHSLLQTGLDHLMVVLYPEDPLVWTALNNALVDDLFVAVHITIAETNQAQVIPLLNRLAQMGIKAVSISAGDMQLKDALLAAREEISNLKLELVWNLPVPYSGLHPIALELPSEVQTSGAGRDWLYVEPDGDVLPSQGINQVLGNMLTDPWKKIWK